MSTADDPQAEIDAEAIDRWLRTDPITVQLPPPVMATVIELLHFCASSPELVDEAREAANDSKKLFMAHVPADIASIFTRNLHTGVCRGCGCTDDNACLDPATGEACHWIAPNLCSACASPPPAAEAASDVEVILGNEFI